MNPEKSSKKRVIVAHWKNRSRQEIEVFSNLKNFCETYPEFSYSTLNNYLGKAKTSFENNQLILKRQELIMKSIQKEIKTRSIQAVVKKYAMESHDEAEQNLDFWLASEPESRIYAVTKLITTGMSVDEKVDRKKVEKLKMKKCP